MRSATDIVVAKEIIKGKGQINERLSTDRDFTGKDILIKKAGSIEKKNVRKAAAKRN